MADKFAQKLGINSSEQAFKSVYNNLTFEWCAPNCVDSGFGWAYNDHTIKFDDMYANPIQAVRLTIHELGHMFDRMVCASRTANGACDDHTLFNNSARSDLDDVWNSVTCGIRLCLSRTGHSGPQPGMYWGFAGGFETWQYGASDGSGEVWADMFLAWTYGQWGADSFGTKKSEYMNNHMSDYLMDVTR